MTRERAFAPLSLVFVTVCVAASVAACGNNNAVSSNADAAKAYLGLDPSIDQAITLGFAGFNSASSANISPQTANGTHSGTLTVTGQVDQGTSANKGMRLMTAYTNFSDDGMITYDTNPAALPALTMQLKGIPSGTLSGTLVGTVNMTGTESGALALNLSFTGTLQPGDAGAGVVRAPGTTHITGTATSSAGTYTVDVTR
jgi:hypothetical protein